MKKHDSATIFNDVNQFHDLQRLITDHSIDVSLNLHFIDFENSIFDAFLNEHFFLLRKGWVIFIVKIEELIASFEIDLQQYWNVILIIIFTNIGESKLNSCLSIQSSACESCQI